MGSGKPRSTTSLNWEAIHRDGHVFQRMALDLFGDKYEDGFTPGPLHRGPDGGWDGLFEGRLEGCEGFWKIACGSYKDLASLRRKVRSENKTARDDDADALLVLSSLEVNPRDVRELNTLAARGLKCGRVWPRAKLNRLVRDNPWVAAS